MLKTALKRGVLSFLIGIGISQIVSIIISLGMGRGGYVGVLPEFRAHFPNETTAVIAQALAVGLLSAVFAASSVFFSIEKWSFPLQCAVHFLVTASVWIPVVCIVWTPKSMPGLLIAPLNFLLAYAVTWGIQVAVNRRTARAINEKIRQNHSEEDTHERH